jgi:hypothetical protein
MDLCEGWTLGYTYKVQAWLGYAVWNINIHFWDFLFFLNHFFHDLSYIYNFIFFLMSNEIILFQKNCEPLKYLFFRLWKWK